MKQLNKYSELYVDCSMAHGLDDDCICATSTTQKFDEDSQTCVPCTYGSTFGTSATDQKTTVEYMAGRIAVFTQAIMASASVLQFGAKGESFFKDCENKRECYQSSNPTPCNQTTLCDGNPVFK